MKKYAIFDCDDVLCDTASALKIGIEEILGYQITPVSSWYTWHFEEMFPDLNFNDLSTWVQDNKILQNINPNPSALEVIEQVKRKNYRTIIVTARGYMPDGLSITKQWVKKFDIPIDNVFCVSTSINKGSFIKTLPREVRFFIDDHHDHIIGSQQINNIQYPILLNKPWNKNTEVNYRIDDIQEILAFV